MSIFSTWWSIERDGFGDEEPLGPPWLYQGSHILPQVTDPRGGSMDLSAIPNHIERDYAGPGLHDWLRIGIEGKAAKSVTDGLHAIDVILNRKQAESLRNVLDAWLKAEERN